MDSKVLTPCSIGAVTFKNRILMPSMCLAYCDDGGFFADRYMAFIMARIRGGVGGVIIPGSPYGAESAGRPAISDDRYIQGWKKLADEAHRYGAKLICQIHPVPFVPKRVEDPRNAQDYPKELIAELVAGFARAARRCQAAGVDGLEIHGAHGHEIAVFTSPYTNPRTDEYGGDYVGRAKFGCEVIRAVKAACGRDYPLIYRMMADDKMPGGLRLEEAIQMAKLFEEAGADALHVSAGIFASEEYFSASMDFEDCLLAEDAAQIKANVHIPIIAVDRIVDIGEADELIADGKADMAAMGRALLADPELVNKYAGLNDMPVRRCLGCNMGCRFAGIYADGARCTQNPLLGREDSLQADLVPLGGRLPKVMIVGAGPGGLEAAAVLAQHGLIPAVYERGEDMGGLVNLAAVAPFKKNMLSAIEYRRKLLDRYGVPVRYGVTVDEALIRQEKPDILIVATGSRPLVPDIPGIEQETILTGDEALMRGGMEGRRVAVLGGGAIGCEVAEFLRGRENEVEIFEMKDALASELRHWLRKVRVGRMLEAGVVPHTKTQVTSVDLPRIGVTEDGAQKVFDGFDAVVAAVGRKPDGALAERAAGLVDKVYVIGDARASAFAIDAIRDGFDAAVDILGRIRA